MAKTQLKNLTHFWKIPKKVESIFTPLTELTDEFSKKYLDEEYTYLFRKLAATLCRKRPSPVQSRNIRTWAAGMVHALSTVNFLFDKSQPLHISVTCISEHYSLGKSTIGNKSKEIRNILKMSRIESTWMTKELIDKSSLLWMISLNGFIVDIRSLPFEIQEEAFRENLIPYLPDQEVT